MHLLLTLLITIWDTWRVIHFTLKHLGVSTNFLRNSNFPLKLHNLRSHLFRWNIQNTSDMFCASGLLLPWIILYVLKIVKSWTGNYYGLRLFFLLIFESKENKKICDNNTHSIIEIMSNFSSQPPPSSSSSSPPSSKTFV